MDGSGYSYVTGNYSTAATFGEGETNQTTLRGPGSEIFVAKYDRDGDFVWATDAGGSSNDYGNAIAVDGSGYSYVTGYYNTSATFGEGEANQTTLSGSSAEIFVTKYKFVITSHVLDGTTYLGACADSESDGLPEVDAEGDDNNTGTITVGTCAVAGNDEDGVTFGTLTAGISFTVNVAASTPGNLSAWIDWNADGDWDDTDEQVFADQTLSAGTNSLNVSVPVDAIVGDTYTRFRFSSDEGLSYTGAANNGEVEDYKVIITANTLPAITVVQPDGTDDFAGTSYTITWSDSDPEEDATITLFYDTDNIGQNGTQIIDCDPISENDSTDSCEWNTSGVIEGDYYVYAIINDGVNPSVVDYSDGAVTIDHTSPVISFTDDVAAGPVQSDEVTITVTETNPDAPTYEYGFSTDSTCNGTDTYGNTFTSGTPFTINTEDYNGKWICAKATDLAGNTSYQASVNPLNIESILTVTIDQPSIPENGGTSDVTVTRSTGTSGNLTVNLSSDDTSEATVPASVTINDGSNSATLTVTAQDDNIVDGTKTVTITASATGYTNGTDTVDITDDETTTLNISTLTDAAPEGSQLQYEAQIDTLAEFDVIVDYTITGFGASQADGADFAGGATGQVTITAVTLSTPVNLNILTDGVAEYEEGLMVTLSVNGSTAGPVSIGTVEATGTITNLASQKSAGSIPADTETGVSAMQKLSWMPGVDHEKDSLTYDLYLAKNTTPTTPLVNGLTANFYQPKLLSYNTIHYWRVDITDYAGNVTTGDVWSFTTETSAEAECPGLGIMCNPSFEFGTDRWTANGDTNMAASTDAYDGLGSISSEQLRTSAQNPRWAGFSQSNVTGFEAGGTYNLQLHAKGINITQGHVKIKWYDAGSTLITTTYPLTGIEGTISNWTWYNRVFTVPNNAVTAEFIIWHGVTVAPQNFAGSTLMVDKIIWQPATEYCGTICNENFEAGLLFWTQQGKPGSNTVIIGGAKDGTRSIRSEQLYTAGNPLLWTGIRQTAEVTEGQVYKLRMWFKTLNAESGHVRLTWKDTQGANISTIYPITGISGTNGTWYKREATLTPPANATKAEVVILHGVSGGANVPGSTIWVDNITMICSSLCNGGFENGMGDWSINGYKDVDIETTNVHEGASAVLLLQDATNADNTQWSGISQRLKVTGGNNYNVSLWLKKLSAVQGHVKVSWRDADDKFISNSFPASGIEGTDLNWTQYTSQLNAPANADTAEIYIWHGFQQGIGNMTGSRLWVDDVQFN